MSELDEAKELDCGRLAWASKCIDVRPHSPRARHFKSYPCVAAGLCPVEDEDSDISCKFSWKRLQCLPATACVRRFPARCEVNAGIRAWRRTVNVLGKHAGLMASALANQPSCSDENAGPYCVAGPAWFGSQACEFGSWFVPFAYGTLASIRAVESPGGDDDRQWLTVRARRVAMRARSRAWCVSLRVSAPPLSPHPPICVALPANPAPPAPLPPLPTRAQFWICFFLFSILERFTRIALSGHIPVYYE